VLNRTTPTLHEAAKASDERRGKPRRRDRHPRSSDPDVHKLPNCIPLAKRSVDDYYDALRRLRERIELSRRPLLGSAEAPLLIASLERIANLRRSGALSEHEGARLKKVLLESAAGGMTL
jgi:hypothetical protein